MLQTLNGHTDSVEVITISPDGKNALSGSSDNSCIEWDLLCGKPVHILNKHTHKISAISYTPDGRLAVTGSTDGTCILWDLRKGAVIQILKGHTSTIKSILLTPDGKKIITGSIDKIIIVWDLKSGKIMKSLLGHTKGISANSITPDGKLAMSGSQDHNCILWDLERGTKIACLPLNAPLITTNYFPNGFLITDFSGEVIVLHPYKNNLLKGIPITTIYRIWDYENNQYQILTSNCPLCGHLFAPSALALITIESIKKKANLKSEQSPCLELPDEAWEDPGLLGICPKCGGELKFNPFVAGGDD
jgi:WD40 repeat protein